MNHLRSSITTIAVAATISLLSACSSTGTATSESADSGTTTATTASVDADPAATPPTTPPTAADATIPVTDTGPLPCQMSDPIDHVLEVDSDVFGAVERVSVHFTPCTLDQPTPNPILYLLHGAAADETQWPDVDIFAAADRAVLNGTMPPSILVAPDAAGAYTCSGGCASDLFVHLLDEIEPAIQRIAPIDPSHRTIGGISRGGGLALQVAGFDPRQFVAIGAHSSVNAPDEALRAIADSRVPVRLDVGDDDGLADASTAMTSFIDANGGRADLVVSPGGHDRAYWRSQADAYIAFYAAHLR